MVTRRRTSSGWRSREAALLAIACAASAAGCGSTDTTPAEPGPDGGGQHESVCASDPRAQVYVAGLESAADDGAVRIRFVDAKPAPPSKGNNEWVIQILDGSGAAIDGATVSMKPFMPDHGHGSSITPRTTPMGSDGKYGVDLVNFFMPGIWQITFHVEPPGGADDTVVFTFCIEG